MDPDQAASAEVEQPQTVPPVASPVVTQAEPIAVDPASSAPALVPVAPSPVAAQAPQPELAPAVSAAASASVLSIDRIATADSDSAIAPQTPSAATAPAPTVARLAAADAAMVQPVDSPAIAVEAKPAPIAPAKVSSKIAAAETVPQDGHTEETAPPVTKPSAPPKAKATPPEKKKPVAKVEPKPKKALAAKSETKPPRQAVEADATKAKKPVDKPQSGSNGKSNADARRGEVNGVDGARASRSSKGGAATSASGNAAVSNYPGKIVSKLRRALRYPTAAKRQKLRGETLVAFTVTAGGGVGSVRVARSSGSDVLDRAALETVRRAAPFPPIPAGAGRSTWAFSVPLGFTR